MPTTSARSSASGSPTRASRACSRSRASSSTTRSPSASTRARSTRSARTREHGQTVILSDGDVVFQPLKVERSGIGEAVDGDVLIYVHKEHELDDVEARYPADRYVLVDDKLRILHAMKEQWGERVTTVFLRQGHYALDPDQIERYPAADVTIEAIGELVELDLGRLRA